MSTALLTLVTMFGMVAVFYVVSWFIRLFRDDESPAIDPRDVFDQQ